MGIGWPGQRNTALVNWLWAAGFLGKLGPQTETK